MFKRFMLALAILLAPVSAYAIPPYQTTATIPSGTHVSSLVSIAPFSNLGPPHSVQVEIPSAWTAANLTILVCSSTGAKCAPLYDGAGNQYTIVVTAASTIILLDPSVLSYISYLEFQSGTSGSPVNQAADRTLTVNLY